MVYDGVAEHAGLAATLSLFLSQDSGAFHFDRMQYGQGAASALPICAIYLKKVYADKELGYSEEEQFDIPEWFDPNAGCK